MAGPTITAAGLQIQDVATIRSELATAMRTKTGIQTLLADDDSSPLGQFLGVLAERESLVQELTQDLYLAAYVVSATGAALDLAVARNGITRDPATQSTVVLQVTNPNPPAGGALTVPAGAIVELSTGDRWGAVLGGVVADGATVAMDFMAIEAGPITAPASSSWSWVTSFTGSNELTLANAAAAETGAAEETDPALRVRYFQALAQPGAGTLRAVLAKVLTLATVQQARVYENDTDTTGIATPEVITDLPPHSLLLVARGTFTDAQVCALIWAGKPGGIGTWGNTLATITDGEGIEHLVRYQAASEKVCTLVLTITGSASAYAAAVKAACVAYVTALGLGDNVAHVRLVAAVLGAALGATAVSGTLNGTALSLSGALAVAYDEFATLASGGITITWA